MTDPSWMRQVIANSALQQCFYRCLPAGNSNMGVNVSRSDESMRRHIAAEKLILEDKAKNQNIYKLLLLGPAESGKSTIVKQMRILHTEGFSELEKKQQQSIIAGNVLRSITTIIKAMEAMGIKFSKRELENYGPLLVKAEQEWHMGCKLDYNIWMWLKAIWQDEGTQKCFQRSHEYQLDDSTKYFCDDIDRIASPNFVPAEQDVLRARAATLGIVEVSFVIKGLTIRVIDVGGQRSQRKKWIHCFEGINGLIFVAALSEYNQTLLEDNKINRLHESLKLFETICNCQWFLRTPMLLFLNKKDIFAEKVKKFSITVVFPQYTGPSDYNECANYIQDQFDRQKKNKKKIVYCHKTCATDTKNIEFVLEASLDIITSANMKKSGLY